MRWSEKAHRQNLGLDVKDVSKGPVRGVEEEGALGTERGAWRSLGLVLVRYPKNVPLATVWKAQCGVGVLKGGRSQTLQTWDAVHFLGLNSSGRILQAGSQA